MGQRAGLASSLLVLAVAACGREASPPPASPVPSPEKLSQSLGTPYFYGVLSLTHAASNLQPNIVRALLEQGADPNERQFDATSWPALAIAMKGQAMTYETSEPEYNARRRMMEILLTHRADPNIRWCDSERPQCNESTGVTPLMYAATLGYQEFTDILLKHGADQSLRDWNGLRAADYWGLKPAKRPVSWCLAPLLKKHPGDYAPDTILNDARWFVNPDFLEQQSAPEGAAIIEALTSSRDRLVEIVKDERVCEAGAAAYARHRVMEQSEPKPRPVVPVAVVRAGPAWIVDDQADGGGRGIFDRSWRFLTWFAPPD